jgi:hypothetical protein
MRLYSLVCGAYKSTLSPYNSLVDSFEYKLLRK